jgi:hypothetical protein
MSANLPAFWDGPLSFREWAMGEPLPLATVHTAVLEFLRGRNDVALYGAQAVNAYVTQPRATQDVDIAALHAVEVAEEIRAYLNQRFHIAVRVREVRDGIGYRIYQVQKPQNRHLVDVRPSDPLPPTRLVAGVQVVTPEELIAGKVQALHSRRAKPKSGTDWRDLAMLFLSFPELKADPSVVRARLEAAGADEAVLATWAELAAQEVLPEDEDDEFQ